MSRDRHPPRTPLPLRHLIVSRVSQGAAITLLMLITLVGWFFHRQLHSQTDAVLIALAAAEYRAVHDLAHHTPSQETVISKSNRATLVSLPWGGSAVIETSWAALNDRCEILGHSLGFTPQLDEAQCSDSEEAFFIYRDDGVELRAARYRDHDQQFIVGIEHRPLDAALWRSVALCALASLCAWFCIWWITKRVVRTLTADLVMIENACRELDLDGPYELNRLRFNELGHHGESSREIITLDETLREMLKRLQESVKTQRRFIADAAHELRTPLTGLKGEIEVALRRSRNAAEYRETLGYLAGDVERLERLSDRLLRTTHDQERTFKLEELELIMILKDALEVLNLKIDGAEDKPRIELHDFSENSYVIGERDASLRAMINIIQNAQIHSQAKMITLKLITQGAMLSLVVEDDGKGIPKELKPYLFTPFIKGEGSRGHGLGLSICADLMRAQGGELKIIEREELNSRHKRGTRVELFWQRA